MSNTGVGSGSGDARFASGLMSRRPLGHQSSEDLGGGLKAVFNLENGFNIGTGSMSQAAVNFWPQRLRRLGQRYRWDGDLGSQNEFMYGLVGHVSF